ncbi:hypothetical protein GCM10020295_35250 [Streptomyces cinereospinus]
MAEQDGGRPVAYGGGVQGGVAGVPGGGFGAVAPADAHGGGLHRVQAQLAQPQHDLLGAQVGAGLQAVVDSDAARADAESGGASKASAEASAMESAPPEQATSTSGDAGRSRGPGASAVPGVSGVEVCSVRMSWRTRRTARRIAATAGWGPIVRFPS